MSLKIYVSAGPPIGYLRFTRFVSGIGPTWSTTILRGWKCSKELETILKFHIILFCFLAFFGGFDSVVVVVGFKCGT